MWPVFHQHVLKPAVRFQVPKIPANKYPSIEMLALYKLINFESVQSQPDPRLFQVMMNISKV